jgi:hypothetical protein
MPRGVSVLTDRATVPAAINTWPQALATIHEHPRQAYLSRKTMEAVRLSRWADSITLTRSNHAETFTTWANEGTP